MDRLKDTIQIIDDSIADFYEKDIKFYGICRLEKKGEETIPVFYKGFGDYEFVGFDSSQAMNIYHRIISEGDDEDDEGGYGRDPLAVETFSMIMVVFGNMRKIDDTNTDINYRIADEFTSILPRRFTAAQATSIDARSILLSVTGKEYNKESVFLSELPDNEYNLKPENLLFSLSYDLNLTYT